jgi:phenylpropionate dioxygenase-like ring-hydroxylating dioxygenase large terminal subunit
MGHADPALDTAAQAARILDTGLLDLWYPVAPSWSVGNAPIGITRLSRQIVLWRDAQGQVHALEDRCPHRGARLSLGWNLGDRVACWYHGVEVDGKGKVCNVPAVKTCPMEGEQRVRSYPVQERAGAIFLWFGVDPKAPPAELQLPEQLDEAGEWSQFLCMSNWKVNYRYAIDNVMDPMHGAYLHATSHSMAEATSRPRCACARPPPG